MNMTAELINGLQRLRYRVKARHSTQQDIAASYYELGAPEHASLCLYAGYNYHHQVPDYVFEALNQLKALEFDLIYLSASPLNDDDIQRLQPLCRGIIEKTNAGLDFSSWKCGLSLVPDWLDYDGVLLTNDSVFGPMSDLSKHFTQMQSFDGWGMTDSLAVKWHLQSYFLYFSSRVTRHPAWQQFWEGVQAYDNKYKIVFDYEIGLSQWLLAHGFNLGCAYSTQKILASQAQRYWQYPNITLACWEACLNQEFPYLKRDLFKPHNYHRYHVKRWSKYINPDYSKHLIEQYLSTLPADIFITQPYHRYAQAMTCDHSNVS